MLPASRGHWWASQPQWLDKGGWSRVSFVSSPSLSPFLPVRCVYGCREKCYLRVLAVYWLDNDLTLTNYFHLNLKIVREHSLQKTALFLTIDHCTELNCTVGPLGPQQNHSESCLIMNKNDSCVMGLKEKRLHLELKPRQSWSTRHIDSVDINWQTHQRLQKTKNRGRVSWRGTWVAWKERKENDRERKCRQLLLIPRRRSWVAFLWRKGAHARTPKLHPLHDSLAHTHTLLG